MDRKKKILVFDLDGTLLDSRKQVTKKSREALEEMARKGMLLAVATGRPLGAIPENILNIEAIRYLIASNGAVVYDRTEEKIIRRTSIPEELRAQILDACQGEEVAFEAFLDGKTYIEQDFFEKAQSWSLEAPSMEYLRSTRTGVPDLREMVQQSRYVEGIGIRLRKPEQNHRLREILKKLPGLYITSSLEFLVEAASEDTDKCKALEAVLQKEGMSLPDAVAFGDADNDVELLEAAGTGVAMGNGSEACKQAADFVTKSNDDEGIAYALLRGGIL